MSTKKPYVSLAEHEAVLTRLKEMSEDLTAVTKERNAAWVKVDHLQTELSTERALVQSVRARPQGMHLKANGAI